MKINFDRTSTPYNKHQDVTGASDRLKKQIESIEQQINKIKDSKDAPETKAEKIKQLEKQLQNLETQLQQTLFDEKQREIEEATTKMAEKDDNHTQKNQDGDEVILSNQLGIIAAEQRFGQIKTLRKVQINLKAQGDLERAAQVEAQMIKKAATLQYDMRSIVQSYASDDDHEKTELKNSELDTEDRDTLNKDEQQDKNNLHDDEKNIN